MFTLYGNQYESREEHLLLTMFQVKAAYCLFSRPETLTARNLTFMRARPPSSTVRAIRAIRDSYGVWFPPARQYSGVPNDDDLH